NIMGLLSNLFGFIRIYDDDDDELEDEEELEEEEEDKNLPPSLTELRVGMTLDVIGADNKLILSGRITGYRNGCATLERLPGWISFEIIPKDTEVSVRGYNNKMVQLNWTAKVTESSRVLCKLDNIKAIKATASENQRQSFRIFMKTPASLYRKEDERLLRPEICTLIDVSTGGCCVESEYVHEDDEVLRIKIKLEDYQPMQFLGQIIRASQEDDGHYRYGILFAQLTEEELTSLTRTLYNIQVGNRREWTRSESGSFH
ncbi:MAG: PilZ domain-containing protein, partial [Oscillospiraceae bacterium]|nr:PilZ domain-containing protein [Oscillospiraceae bacterium]